MGTLIKRLFALALFATAPAYATGLGHFKHIVIIFQENRTPDTLFYSLCLKGYACGPGGYDIQTANWSNNQTPSGVTQPQSLSLGAGFDIGHRHEDWIPACDGGQVPAACLMDGFAADSCNGTCPTYPEYYYVDDTAGTIDSYIFLATQYGWANYMFQANQGPSFPSHQFIFGATSAPSQLDDARNTFVADNAHGTGNGCIADSGTTVELVTNGVVSGNIFPCLDHETISDLLEAQSPPISWKYYTPSAESLWTAPNAIRHICQLEVGSTCDAPDFIAHVDLNPNDVLTDIQSCTLAQMSWVIPNGPNSDHPNPKGDNVGGPSWVRSIVNAIGNQTCSNGESYWADTAIIIAWDDWGGWYDHEPPNLLGDGYEWGFRVPMLFVSAYTPLGYIDNTRMDFGAIANFIEHNFGIAEGSLGFDDYRSTGQDLSEFYNFNNLPRQFVQVPGHYDAKWFLSHPVPLTPPDDD